MHLYMLDRQISSVHKSSYSLHHTQWSFMSVYSVVNLMKKIFNPKLTQLIRSGVFKSVLEAPQQYTFNSSALQ